MKRLIFITTVIAIVLVIEAISPGQPLHDEKNPFAPLYGTDDFRAAQFGRMSEDKIVPEGLKLHLNAIVWSKEKPMAIINDTIVIPGSEILGARVDTITNDCVKLHYRGESLALRITHKIRFTVKSKQIDDKNAPKTKL